MSQRGIQVLARANSLVIDQPPGTIAADRFQELVERGKVTLSQGPRVADDVARLLEPLELRRPRKTKIEFFIVEDVKHHHVVAAVPEQTQTFVEDLRIDEQIRDQD